MEEIWKDIEGYEGKYQVSSLGRVKALPTKFRLNEKIRKLAKDKDGYIVCELTDIHQHAKLCKVHRLVCFAFHEKPEGKDIVNHIDSCRSNNNFANLEWCTRSENVKHAFLHGFLLPTIGERHGMAVLTGKDASYIRDEYFYSDCKRGMQEKIAKGFGISPSMVRRIITRLAWKHVR
jgi:hypothetical protein